MKIWLAAFVGSVALLPVPAFAWGALGHHIIGALAMENLPADMPGFLRAPGMASQIGELAREPDRSRNAGQPHDDDRDPGHFVDVSDDLTILGGPSLKALPANRKDYDTALRAVGATQYKAGFLPYSIIDGWEQLKMDFALWRADSAGEKFAKTDADRAWLANDRLLREMLVVRDLGIWAHFVGDGSQPMHASVHYNGWGDFPNPEGFVTAPGFHSKFESAYVNANIAEADVAAFMRPFEDCGCAITAQTSAYLIATQAQVAPVYRLEKAHAFDTTTPDGKAFRAQRIADGANMLRDMIVEAWRQSDDMVLGYTQKEPVKDIEAGKYDPLAILRD